MKYSYIIFTVIIFSYCNTYSMKPGNNKKTLLEKLREETTAWQKRNHKPQDVDTFELENMKKLEGKLKNNH